MELGDLRRLNGLIFNLIYFIVAFLEFGKLGVQLQ